MVDEVSGGTCTFDIGVFDCLSDIGLGLAKDMAESLEQNFGVGSVALAVGVSNFRSLEFVLTPQSPRSGADPDQRLRPSLVR